MKQTIVGNLTGDPELRFTPSGAAVANFTVAENHRRFNKQTNEWEDTGTSFYACSVWREAAENVAESLTKGMQVIASGEVQQEQYERRDGTKGMSVNMTVDDIGPTLRFATAKVTRSARGGQGAQGGQQPQQQRGGWGNGQPAAAAPAQGSDPWATTPGSQEPPF